MVSIRKRVLTHDIRYIYIKNHFRTKHTRSCFVLKITYGKENRDHELLLDDRPMIKSSYARGESERSTVSARVV